MLLEPSLQPPKSTDNLFHAMLRIEPQTIDGTVVTNRHNRQNRSVRHNLLPKCYQIQPRGPEGWLCGISPFSFRKYWFASLESDIDIVSDRDARRTTAHTCRHAAFQRCRTPQTKHKRGL